MTTIKGDSVDRRWRRPAGSGKIQGRLSNFSLRFVVFQRVSAYSRKSQPPPQSIERQGECPEKFLDPPRSDCGHVSPRVARSIPDTHPGRSTVGMVVSLSKNTAPPLTFSIMDLLGIAR